MLPFYIYLLIAAGIGVWFYPFVGAHKTTPPAATVNRRSRWGVLLQLIAFCLLWQGHFWTRPLIVWRLAACLILFALASLLSWSSSRALAGQLRIDAALGAEHRLVRSGPYSLVRNPIYTSMLLLLCAIAVMITGWGLFLVALIVFIAGTEIRVRAEEKLLALRFGQEYEKYKKSVAAYVPYL